MEPEGLFPCSQEPAVGPLLSHINPIHSLQPCFPQIHRLIVYSTSSDWSLSFKFLNRNLICITHPPHAHYMSYQSNPL
jgi:hypothetical protein